VGSGMRADVLYQPARPEPPATRRREPEKA